MSAFEPSSKRRRLTNKEKLDVIAAVKNGASQAAVSKEFKIPKATLSGIMKDASNIQEHCKEFSYMLEKKAIKITSQLTFLDKPLLDWMENRRKNIPDLMITGSVIQRKAVMLYKEKNSSQTSSDANLPTSFVASKGWLHNFLKRNNIRSYRTTYATYQECYQQV